jgi:hypothetical protein
MIYTVHYIFLKMWLEFEGVIQSFYHSGVQALLASAGKACTPNLKPQPLIQGYQDHD